MNRRVKCWAMNVASKAGALAASERATSHALRIIGYHGSSMGDEHQFRPGVFLTSALLESRLDWLVANGFTVLPLEAALSALRAHELPPKAVVLTFDDGFYGTYQQALPALRARGLPATIYVSSYYMLKGGLVFRLAVQYIFWKTRAPLLSLAPDGVPGVAPGECSDANVMMWRVINWAEKQLKEPERRDLARRLADKAQVDYDQMAASRALGFMTLDEVRDASEQGFDIQLHTHHHCFDCDVEKSAREIDDNRRVLEPIVGRTLNHFCYPSGEYHAACFPMLANKGIASATTSDRGLNTGATSRYLLRRFMDREDILPIEFEAELRGVNEVIRNVLHRSRRAQEVASFAPLRQRA